MERQTLTMQPASAVLTIDLEAIVSNYRTLAHRAAPTECSAVVKADGYGLGATTVGAALLAAGCQTFFVAALSEGLDLRSALGPAPRIFVLNGLPPGGEALCLSATLLPVLSSVSQVKAWSEHGNGAPAALQVDTGMSRFGLSVTEQVDLAGDLARLNLVLLMSHLANADEPEHRGNAAQLEAFRAAKGRFPTLPASLANSAGTFLGADYRFDLCRPGAALYGIEAGPRVEGIVPTVQLTAQIAQIRTVAPGTHIGYGYTFEADRPMRIATIAVGYGDGWPRHLSNGGAVWFGDYRLPIVGRVSMDSFMADISAVPPEQIAEGVAVELIGPHQTADDVGRLSGTIGYEILTRLGRRYARTYRAAKE
ncbi:alanine racemase [Devosia sp.]|uniref:alanine racemase n=1 Tax=Devosia sp. TaxID=1871048 RepID=UPI0032651C75